MSEEEIEYDGVMFNTEEIEEVFDALETSLEYADIHLSHDEVRPSAHIMATKTREAYEKLVKAHPVYELEE